MVTDQSKLLNKFLNKLYGPWGFWLCALLITLIHIAYVFFNQRPLGIDEAQYWSWSEHLAWGYHSKSPMIAWLIYLAVKLCGANLFSIRFFSPLAYAVSALMIYFSAEKLYASQKISFYSALLFILLPGVTFSASIISTDPFLILFWSIGLFNFLDALEKESNQPNDNKKNSLNAWMTLGLAMGLGLMTKYTALVFILGVVFSWVILKIKFEKFKNLKFSYLSLSLLIAFIIFLPNLIWNAAHGWVTVLHVSEHNVDLAQAGWHWGALGDFILAQIGIMGPVFFILFCFALFKNLFFYKKINKNINMPSVILFFQIAPLLLGIMIEAVVSHAYGNWAAPIYIAVCMMIAHGVFSKNYKIIKIIFMIGLLINILLGACFYLYELTYPKGFSLFGVSSSRWMHHDPFYQNRPWPVLGQALMNFRMAHWGAKYLFNDRAILSELMFYLKLDPTEVYSFNPNHSPAVQYDLSTRLTQGSDYIFITEDKNYKNSPVILSFESIKLLDTVSVFIKNKNTDFYVLALKNFKGY